MKILFLPNWDVHFLKEDNASIQSPDKYLPDSSYWFFKYFPRDTEVDVIDRQRQFIFHHLEARYLKFYIYQSFKAFFCRKHYDVVISHGAQSGLFYSLLNRFRRKKKRALHLIIDVGAMNGGRTNKIEISFIRFALKSNPMIVFHSSVQQLLYDTTYHDAISRYRFIRFGVDLEEFKPQDAEVKNYVLAFGYAKRDYPTLLNAWKEINTTAELFIVGNDSIQGDGNIKSYSKVSVVELQQYIACSLFVVIPLPVFNYSYGQMSFIQSMAMGKPVIVTRTPSSIDYIRDGTGAFFVNPYDVEDMKSKLLSLLNSKSQLQKIGQDARDYIAANLNEKEMATAMYEFICSK